jgi:CheY-like chemotaxis protein
MPGRDSMRVVDFPGNGDWVVREYVNRHWHGAGNQPPVPDTTAPRVLLIEDDPAVRDSIRELLDYFGYECGVAADGPSGLKRLEQATWDLVLTDLTLPGMTGWHVVDAIRKRVPGLPVIVISGAEHPNVRTAARQCGVSVLFKPFGIDALKAVLVDALYAPLALGGLPPPSD